MVLVISPLNALMGDQVKKLKTFKRVDVLKYTDTDTTDQQITTPRVESNFHIVFAHPEINY